MTSRKPIIWIVNEAGHPYHKALNLIPNAELKPLTLGNTNPLEIDRLNWHLARGIVSYATKDDYLLISGTPAVNAAAMTLWILHFGVVKLLQWNAKMRQYKLATLEKQDLEKLLERTLTRL